MTQQVKKPQKYTRLSHNLLYIHQSVEQADGNNT